jgi:hypothetical protein
MQLCEICKEPAARRVISSRVGQVVTSCYCYVHAVEAGLSDVPLALLERAAALAGYPVNGLIFVLESLIRAGCITEAEAAEELVGTMETPKTPLELCVAVSRAAVERFQQQAGLALSYWNLTRAHDLGVVLSSLVRSGALATSAAGQEKVLAALSAMEGPLVVEAGPPAFT